MSKTRKSGFYWVKYPHGVWMIAMWTHDIGWSTFHGEGFSQDIAFDEIDERRVTRPYTIPWKDPKEAFDAGFKKGLLEGKQPQD